MVPGLFTPSGIDFFSLERASLLAGVTITLKAYYLFVFLCITHTFYKHLKINYINDFLFQSYFFKTFFKKIYWGNNVE